MDLYCLQVKTFSRLLGAPPTARDPALPPGAGEFYFALLNRSVIGGLEAGMIDTSVSNQPSG